MDWSNGTEAAERLTPHSLLTPDNCVVAPIDYQPRMLFGVANVDRQSVVNNAVELAKAARTFNVPVVLSTVESTSFSGPTWPILLAALGNPEPIERSSMNAWDDSAFVAAIERTGRAKIVLAGLWTEACVAFPTISAIADPAAELGPRGRGPVRFSVRRAPDADPGGDQRGGSRCGGW
jgi:hypothetical protein